MRILVVDDTTFMRATIRQLLEHEGQHAIFESDNGLDALTKYRIHKPDLVIMDISMPVMDGIEAVSHIRKIDPSADILICSLQGQRASVMQAIQAGARGFLLKPINKEKLYAELETSKKIATTKQSHVVDKGLSKEQESANLSALDALIAQTYEELEGVTLDLMEKNPSEDYLKGIKRGYLEARREIAINMVRLSLNVEVIKKCVELSDEDLDAFVKAYRLD